MKKFIIVIGLLLYFININGQCGITGMQTQILQNSDFPITNTSGNTSLVKIVDGNYPATVGVEDNNAVPGNAKPFSSLEIGKIVSSSTTVLGTYKVRLSNSAGCIDAVEVKVVASLPVTWSKPAVVRIEKSFSIISFSTAQQINNSHFEIEHSVDGRKYHSIGRVEGESNTSIEIDYEYIHDNPTIGTNYYRIKQVDYGGRYSYSNAASVEFRTDKVSVHPNPVTERLMVSSPSESSVAV